MKYCAVALLAIAAIASAQVPIPSKPDGISYNKAPSAGVQLEVFIDLMCPDSRDAWPNLLAVVQHYGDKVNLLTHVFPLPYHFYSFASAQASYALVQDFGVDFFDWVDVMWKNQEKFGNSVTANSTQTEVFQQFAELANSAFGVDTSKMVAGLNDASINWDVRVSWKYGCSRGVAGTPWFMVNGVVVNASPSWGVKEWSTVIDPLLPSTKTSSLPTNNLFGHTFTDCPEGQPKCEYLPGKIECCKSGEFCIPNVGCRC